MKEKNQITKNLIPILVAVAALFINIVKSNNAKEIDFDRSNKSLSTLNKNFEELEGYLSRSDSGKICSKAINSINIIELNNNGLRALEPNYDWHEIKQVLKVLSQIHCNALTE